MAYVPNRRLYRVVFEGELGGLEVTTRSSGYTVYEQIAELADHTPSSPPSGADREAMRDLLEAFAAVLVEWNLEEPAGVPVPCTLAGLKTQEPAFVHGVVAGWLDAVAEVLAASNEAQLANAFEATLPVEPLVAVA